MCEENNHENKEFSSLTHDKRRIRTDLVEFCKEEGIEARNGFYKIRLVLCEDYLTRIYKNLPTRTVKTLLDILIIQGIVGIKRGEKSERWYVLIPEYAGLQTEDKKE